ncbi:hypothetical protein WJU23_22630 [Prosthecobacter sp. SYSU 5D2]|uniref:hypothetical protein n=1 Tax=Prosthecobacter sp. SYSU 5D2 TaxID=3134134 RepID=UPI0031FE7C5A
MKQINTDAISEIGCLGFSISVLSVTSGVDFEGSKKPDRVVMPGGAGGIPGVGMYPESCPTGYESLKCAANTPQGKRHTPEEITISCVRRQVSLQEAKPVKRPPDRSAVSVPTYHRCKEQHGGAEKSTVKRLTELEKENLRLRLGGGEGCR